MMIFFATEVMDVDGHHEKLCRCSATLLPPSRNQLFFSSHLFTVVTSSQIAVLASNAVSFHAVLSSSFVLCFQLVLAVSVHRNRLAVFSPRSKIEN